MVSKISKRTPTKYVKDFPTSKQHRLCHRRKSLAKKNDAAFSSINKSILTYHRLLIKLFSKLAHLDTSNRQHKGCRFMQRFPINPNAPSAYCSRLTMTTRAPPTAYFAEENGFDFMVRPTIDGEIMNFYVLKRPGVDKLLATLGERFEIVVFTTGLREYTLLVLDQLDGKAMISHRLYRDSCKEVDGKFVKDLSGLGRDLRQVAMVDDNPNAYEFQPENAIPSRPFTNDLNDMELERVIKFLEGSGGFEDMREAMKQYEYTWQTRDYQEQPRAS
ncbi:hypothetical protein I3842_10G101500 [Carya illinoinensis]|uniref:FCP1 homology domain-containing protein n=1 Tax=Carya illinoinensis TaxID=32201 RepID=A0A922DWS2_CARIL|nr:hypothetical protein I3842_10G101500 [Carya illinoinensis]